MARGKTKEKKGKTWKEIEKLRVFMTLCVRAVVRLRSEENAYLGVQAG